MANLTQSILNTRALLLGILEVEGQVHMEDIAQRITDAEKEYNKLISEINALENKEDKEYRLSRRSTGIVIQGAGGVHRYFVRIDGEVEFSSYHAASEYCFKAETAGFTVAH